ncbi:hypothetical protein JI739_24255 [Ramlibacter sp. AW1]|uniref:Uncharacterized protein n=1 Tax=Ramlibacter aurantiacus TaxID=2801330 RepID=A0A936ZZT4_9BURK|nr:hypothetical protein [Ramlibacter aurantiacus]MBL0423464.1 hypothetical protein [Ramlibacter aurantiacus]
MRQRLLVALLACSLISCAGGQQESARAGRPLDFTPEERTLFVDVSLEMNRISLPLAFPAGGIAAWMDSDRVIYSTVEIPGVWKAQPGELPKVILLRISTRTIEETPYRGNLLCYSPGRMIISAPFKPNAGGHDGPRERLVAGRFGSTLEALPDIENKKIISFSCDLNPIVSTDRGMDHTTRISLLPGHGYLRVPRGTMLAQSDGVPLYGLYENDSSKVMALPDLGFFMLTRLTYLRWIDAYLVDRGPQEVTRVVWPDGRHTAIPPPALFSSLGPTAGGGYTTATRDGLLWNFVAWRALWRVQGLYLQGKSGVLRRIDDASVPHPPGVAVSEDGCRIFYVRRAGDPFNARLPLRPTVLNVCKEKLGG